MNCEQYQELISAFLDNDLDEAIFKNVQSHLALCAECAKVCEDCAMILDFCSEDLLEEVSLPPNSKALWCRINNIIETEIKPDIAQETVKEEKQRGWLSKVWHNSWQLSMSQVLTSILGIALISSLLTIVGFKNYSNDVADASPSVFERVLSKVGLAETVQEKRERKIKEQQATIEYWNKRVEARRVNWDEHLREAFDRNLNEINQVVVEYNKILKENPQDELSGEMLDSAMTEKVELLREFSEL
ncbi:MAG: zf-HC2 domain-containing protein [Acidobacteriota bacterium]